MEEHKKNTFRKVCSFLKDIWFPVLILGLVVFACLFGELIATHSPTQGQLSEYLIPPAWCEGGSMEHLLGTDGLGRDIFSRLVTGARTTMMVGIAVVLVAGSIGTLVGVLAGYMGGAVDSLLMRLTDAVLSIPYTLIAMCLSVILGQSSGTVVFVLGITCWSNYAKVVRVETKRVEIGDIPSPIDAPEGCPFSTRCSECTAACGERPVIREVKPGHYVSCVKFQKSLSEGVDCKL